MNIGIVVTPNRAAGRELMVPPDVRSAAKRTQSGWMRANAYAVKYRGTRMTEFAEVKSGSGWLEEHGVIIQRPGPRRTP